VQWSQGVILQRVETLTLFRVQVHYKSLYDNTSKQNDQRISCM